MAYYLDIENPMDYVVHEDWEEFPVTLDSHYCDGPHDDARKGRREATLKVFDRDDGRVGLSFDWYIEAGNDDKYSDRTRIADEEERLIKKALGDRFDTTALVMMCSRSGGKKPGFEQLQSLKSDKVDRFLERIADGKDADIRVGHHEDSRVGSKYPRLRVVFGDRKASLSLEGHRVVRMPETHLRDFAKQALHARGACKKHGSDHGMPGYVTVEKNGMSGAMRVRISGRPRGSRVRVRVAEMRMSEAKGSRWSRLKKHHTDGQCDVHEYYGMGGLPRFRSLIKGRLLAARPDWMSERDRAHENAYAREAQEVVLGEGGLLSSYRNNHMMHMDSARAIYNTNEFRRAGAESPDGIYHSEVVPGKGLTHVYDFTDKKSKRKFSVRLNVHTETTVDITDMRPRVASEDSTRDWPEVRFVFAAGVKADFEQACRSAIQLGAAESNCDVDEKWFDEFVACLSDQDRKRVASKFEVCKKLARDREAMIR